MAKTKKYTSIKKSRKNTSGRPSKAKRDSTKKVNSAKQNKAPAKKRRPYRLRVPQPKPARQLPETALTVKGMTLRQLIKGTPRLMVNSALDVDLIKFNMVSTKTKMPAAQAVCISTDPYRPNKVIRKHKTFIIGIQKDKEGNPLIKKSVNKHSKVLVSCDCESFMFTWEYANAAHGASRIIYCNGQPPVVTNPGLAPGLCKHLVAVARHIIQKNL